MLKQMNLASVDLNLLVLFEIVFQEQHVARAAQRLGLSPSAISHGLRRLRELLGDPLFVKVPKGVESTPRARELAAPVADVLGRVRNVLGATSAFDPATATRRFTLGMPDAIAAVMLPALLARARRVAPNVALSIRHLLPRESLTELEAHTIDVAIAPVLDLPARFLSRPLYPDDFVVVARRGHAFLRTPTLKSYCSFPHVLVSTSGDARGFVDDALENKGLARQVSLVVPSFLLALAALPETPFLSVVPRALAARHAKHFALGCTEFPFQLRGNELVRAVTLRPTSNDSAIAWLLDTLEQVAPKPAAKTKRRRSARSA